MAPKPRPLQGALPYARYRWSLLNFGSPSLTRLQQCGLRPAHKGHEFCGRNCASTWQASNGTIGTGSWYTPSQPQRGQQQFWNPMPPSQGRTLGDTCEFLFSATQISDLETRSTVNGTPNEFKNFGPQGQQPPQMSRQSVSMSNHPFAQQVPGPVTSVRQISSPPVTPMSSGMTMGDLMPPGPPTPTTPGSTPQFFTPTTPTGPGLQDPNQGPPSYSISGGDHSQDPDMEDLIAITNQDVGSLTTSRGQGQTQFSPQVNSPPTGAGGGGTWDPHNPKYFPSQSQPYTSSPFSGMSSTCRLNGCSKPVFVDRITRNRSEYCSQKHRE